MMPGRRAWFFGGVAGVAAGWLIGGMVRKSVVPATNPIIISAEVDPRELYTVVQGQISAFRHNNFLAAYDFAASGIREKFPLEQFSQMIRQTYPRLVERGTVNFGITQFAADTRASAIIYLSNGSDSSPMIYAFVKEHGKWKIEGVQMLQTGHRSVMVVDPET